MERLQPPTVESPCVRNCCLDAEDVCMGCHRTLREICDWHKSTDLQRLQILRRCRLREALRHHLKRAIAWAEHEADRALQRGLAMTTEQLEIARTVGVQHPERIRVAHVDRLPEPDEPALKTAGIEAGLLGADSIALTLGYAVFVRHGRDTRRLLSHELRHVQQYEQHGGIAGFLPLYLKQIVEVGYADAPFEADARAHELDAS
jgi:predicted Fe-S protein YdhL (DUF1289 family)